MTQKIALAGTSSFSVTESTCFSLRAMVFRVEGADLTAVLYIYRKILVVETKDDVPGLSSMADCILPECSSTGGDSLMREAGHWGSPLVSANTVVNYELELLVVKRNVLCVWGKRGMKWNELFVLYAQRMFGEDW